MQPQRFVARDGDRQAPGLASRRLGHADIRIIKVAAANARKPEDRRADVPAFLDVVND
jgi:hypothetical protein